VQNIKNESKTTNASNLIPLGTKNRIEKIQNTTSIPMPDCFENKFQWAKHWIEEHGVTLPPDTSEYRSLRNWFCYKIDQHKKNRLGIDNETNLAIYGIDLSLYEPNTSTKISGNKDSDLIAELIEHKKIYGTYNLNKCKSKKLIEWQSSILSRFFNEGESSRLINLKSLLPDLVFERWGKPNQTPFDDDYRQWWHQAREYETGIKGATAFRGGIHPEAPAKFREWAFAQQVEYTNAAAQSWKIGFLRKNGIIDNPSKYKVSSEREKALIDYRDGKVIGFGKKDRRLDSIFGAFLAIKMIRGGGSDRETCVQLRIKPDILVAIRNIINEDLHLHKFTKHELTDARMICLGIEDAFSPSFFEKISKDKSQLPINLSVRVSKIGKLAFKISKGGFEKYQFDD
jgi:hypothetical protein